MSLILSLETSTSVCSVAIFRGKELLTSMEVHIEQSHASKLAVLVEETRKFAAIELSNLSAIAISLGPGSYTGLRIGTSTAKGLCYALDIPLISINTLEVLAHQMGSLNLNNSLLCPMIDARRMEVYCLLTDGKLKVIYPTKAKIIDKNAFFDLLELHPIVFFGNGSAKCKNVITHRNAFFINDIYPSAKQVGIMAYHKFLNNETEDISKTVPFYLKEFLIKKPAENKIA